VGRSSTARDTLVMKRRRTCSNPLAFTSKVTSTLASPRLARSTPLMENSPSRLLPSVWLRSPSNTRMSISVCQSLTVVNSDVFLHGMDVLRGTTLAKCFPSHSTPRLSGITSTSSNDCVAASRTPFRIAPCTAAPNATASSGCTLLHSALPPKKSYVGPTHTAKRVSAKHISRANGPAA
jgi:hypothetical protein